MGDVTFPNGWDVDAMIKGALGEASALTERTLSIKYKNTSPYFEAVEKGMPAESGKLRVFEKRIPGHFSDEFLAGKRRTGKKHPDRTNPKLVFTTKRAASVGRNILAKVEPDIDNLVQVTLAGDPSTLIERLEALKADILKILQDATPFLPDPESGAKSHLRDQWEVTIGFE